MYNALHRAKTVSKIIKLVLIVSICIATYFLLTELITSPINSFEYFASMWIIRLAFGIFCVLAFWIVTQILTTKHINEDENKKNFL